MPLKDVTNPTTTTIVSNLTLDFRDLQHDAHLVQAALNHALSSAVKHVPVDADMASSSQELPGAF